MHFRRCRFTPGVAPLILIGLLLLALQVVPAAAGSASPVVAYYFTGTGCPHCARVNPVLFGDWLGEYPGLAVVEYEVYGHTENAAVMAGMDQRYGIGLGIPVVFFGANLTFIGDDPILSGVPPFLNSTIGAPASREGLTSLPSLDIASLPGYPRVWEGDRVLVREGQGGTRLALQELLEGGDPGVVLAGKGVEDLGPLTIEHTGYESRFAHSVRFDGWLFGWNGGTFTPATPQVSTTPVPTTTGNTSCAPAPELTAGTIAALAVVNAINPCALAVLVVILLAIITANPGRREKILLAGLAFSLAVFVFYFAYGLVLVSVLSAVRGVA
ncbi:MAG TPA: hypothetical protein VEI51_05515, partial [Methanomicrobiales archaeon]|nr:hypothetical protein [Methanomicrobiales archaeon]